MADTLPATLRSGTGDHPTTTTTTTHTPTSPSTTRQRGATESLLSPIVQPTTSASE